MFICTEKLKLNKFRQVSIPKNRDLFLRVGPRPVKMVDGQVADYNSVGLEALDASEAQLIRESQMPLADK